MHTSRSFPLQKVIYIDAVVYDPFEITAASMCYCIAGLPLGTEYPQISVSKSYEIWSIVLYVTSSLLALKVFVLGM